MNKEKIFYDTDIFSHTTSQQADTPRHDASQTASPPLDSSTAPTRQQQYWRQYYQTHRNEILAHRRSYRLANIDKVHALERESWHRRRAKRHDAYAIQQSDADVSSIIIFFRKEAKRRSLRASSKKYYQKNREDILSRSRQFYKDHKAAIRERQNTRRTRKPSIDIYTNNECENVRRPPQPSTRK